MRTLKPFLPSFFLFVLSLFMIYWLFPAHHPYGGIHLPLSADANVAHSQQILRDLGIDRTGMTQRTQLKGNRNLLRQVQQRFGLEQSNPLLRDSLPGYYWEVRWRAEEPHSLSFGSGSGESKQVQAVADFLKGDVYFQFDVTGKVLEFERKIQDSAKIPTVAVPEAKIIASDFLKKYCAIGSSIGDTGSVISQRSIQMPNRTDHEFDWSARRNLLGNPLKAKVIVSGNQLAKFSIDEEFPKEATYVDSQQIIYIALLLVYFGVGITMIIVAFRRFRSYEIGFRLAIIAGVVTGILYDITSYFEVRGEAGWIMFVTLLVVPLFVGGALFLVWAVSESVVRERWKEKFISFDLLGKGHFLHSRVGRSILHGIAGGTGALALWLVLSYAGDRSFHLWISHSDDVTFRTFEMSSPPLYILAHSFNLTIFNFALFVVFLVSFLRKYIRPLCLLIFVSALVMGILNAGHLYPLPAGFVIQAAVSTIPIWLFCKYDGLASLVSLVTYNALQETAGLFVAANPVYASSGYVMVWIFGCAVAVSLVTLYRKNQITDFDDIAPAFVRHITERERLQQELEIARTVQMSFLPKTNPVSSRLDIASRCAPALEVGGDYYDFIDLGNKKIGVAIGDVSGKGTQAAFFMTLMKGFLNALAHVSDSPSRVLQQANKLFYDNVERGVFISMVYGIFDAKKNFLTLARAGHNPVIMRKSKAQDVQVVNTKGLALGLDQGDTFAKAIEEVSIKFQSGDLFVFYTDGFTEAMNRTKEEFGEGRLCRTVEKYSHHSAAEILEGVFEDIRQFTGKAKQHDDMTIVVVKVI
jgi:hypothetical protein